MTALGGGEAPFFGVARDPVDKEGGKGAPFFAVLSAETAMPLRMQQPRGQRRKAVGRARQTELCRE
jgi:hypothetical protein